MEFKKKGYWMMPSDKNQNVKSFLKKMKRAHSEHKRAYEQSFQRREALIEEEHKLEQEKHEMARKQLLAKELEKMASLRKDREKYYE